MWQSFNSTNSIAQKDDSGVFDDSFLISAGLTDNCV